jgi:hypothetical protein
LEWRNYPRAAIPGRHDRRRRRRRSSRLSHSLSPATQNAPVCSQNSSSKNPFLFSAATHRVRQRAEGVFLNCLGVGMSPATDSELRDTRQNPAYVFNVSEAGLPGAPAPALESHSCHIRRARSDDSFDGVRALHCPALSAATRISSNASQYFFLCGELLKERQMAFRKRSISASSTSSRIRT